MCIISSAFVISVGIYACFNLKLIFVSWSRKSSGTIDLRSASVGTSKFFVLGMPLTPEHLEVVNLFSCSAHMKSSRTSEVR